VSRLKVRILGKLRFSDEQGLIYSISLNRQLEIPPAILYDAVETPKWSPDYLNELKVGDLVVHLYCHRVEYTSFGDY
jgi:hypothetical protein